MKKNISLLLMLLMLALCATPVLAENTQYQDETIGIAFEYPADWVEISAALLAEVAAGEDFDLGLDTTLTREEIEGMLAQVHAYFYNTEKMTDEFTPNLNLVCSAASGITAEMLVMPEFVAQMTQAIEVQMKTMLPSFEWLQQPEAKTLGSTNAFCYTALFDMDGMAVGNYQVMIVNGTTLYTFTYTTVVDDLGEDSIAQIDEILSTVSFL